MNQFKEQKIEELIRQLAAEFLLHESMPAGRHGAALLTVTGVHISDKLSKATILLSVFPDDKQAVALDFAKRKRTEFKEYLKEHAKMRKLPFVDFEIDVGEK